MKRQAYPTDLTDAQWEESAPLLPPTKPGGRPRTVDLREVVKGIRYMLRSGCSWRMLPHDLLPWGAVWWHFRHHRQPIGEDHGKRGPRGYDAGQKVTGRKRHIVVDTLGLLLAVMAHPADLQSRPRAATRGPGRRPAPAAPAPGTVQSSEADLGRWGLPGETGRLGLGPGRVAFGDCPAPPEPPPL